MDNSITYTLIVMCALNIYSLNVNGLCNLDNAKRLFALLGEWKCDICLLQETFWTDNLITEIEHFWNGKLYYSNNDNKKCGVAILVASKWKDYTDLVCKDRQGRLISIHFKFDEIDFDIMCTYAPTDCTDKVLFFDFMLQCLSNRTIIIGGDFNTTFEQKDRLNTIHHFDKGYMKLQEVKTNANIYDIWRKRYPNSKTFSWKRVINDEIKMSRIDYFLISNNIGSYVKNIFYKDTTLSDHSFVYMKIDFTEVETGPGIWILNNTILCENEYQTKIITLIEREKLDQLYNSEFLIWWDNLKYKIKKMSQNYCMYRNKQRYKEYNQIQRKLGNLTDLMASGQNIDIDKYIQLKNELAGIEHNKCEGAILRAKAFWAIEGDKNSKYFLNLEKYKQNMNTVLEISKDDGVIVRDTIQILDEEYKFYSNLYSCVETNKQDIYNFQQNVNTNVNKNDVIQCDKVITKQEIFDSLSTMSKNKSPGSDGITMEFYNQFWNVIGDILLKLYKNVQEEEIMSRSMRHGIISLIYKKGDKSNLRNWRPISLLNVDYKILARIMSNRLKYVLPTIISEDQTCSVIGRDISDNISSVRDIINMVEQEKIEGYLVKIDQEKAFDRISHQYLMEILKRFGFGLRFRKWIQIFYNDIFSAVKCNGFLTKYFPIKNSVRQGCPISALLFVLCAEPLNSAIKLNQNIQGIPVAGTKRTSLMFQHADDTTCTVSNKTSIKNIIRVFDDYGRASGAKVNKSKSEIMCMGTGFLNVKDIEKFGILLCDNYIQILGVYLGKNQTDCDILNWKEKIGKIKKILNIWKQRQLNIHGRATIVSSLLLSRIWYTLMVQPIPDWALKEFKTACLEFIWMKKSYPVRYFTIIGNKDSGGLNIPDIEMKAKAFRLKYLKRFLDKKCTAIWKYTFAYFLRSISNMGLTYQCLYMQLCSKQLLKLPPIYREIMIAWEELRGSIGYDLNVNQIFDQPLFFNPKIVYKGKKLHFEFFIKADIVQLKHLSYEVVPGFIRFGSIKELIQEHSPQISEKSIENAYNIIRGAIPMEWQIVILRSVYKKSENRIPHFILIQANNLTVFETCTTSTFYKSMRDCKFCIPISKQFWETVFQDLDYKQIALNIQMTGKCPDMVELDFKIFHNIIYTESKLKQIGLTDNDVCLLCNCEIETVTHMFLDCVRLTTFMSFVLYYVENLLRLMPNNDINVFDFRNAMLLGYTIKSKNVNYVFLNMFLSQARLCIYKARAVYKYYGKRMNLISFFKCSLEKYIPYIHRYYIIQKRSDWFKRHISNLNCIVKLIDQRLQFNW